MDRYNQAAQAASRDMTRTFSDSFSLASKLFSHDIRPHIYNIYGLVRLADEIADTYTGTDGLELLTNLEQETTQAIKRQFSPNPVVHAFQLTANQFSIETGLISPFFASMETDLRRSYTPHQYQAYIYGSAEVVGLMCLRVFCRGDEAAYRLLQPGAAALGSALQKVNFLRDLADDYSRLGRYYFPVASFENFNEDTKQTIIRDIRQDFAASYPAILQLPSGVRPAVLTAYRYYVALLETIAATPAARLKQRRVRVPNYRKLAILAHTVGREKLRG